MAEALTDRERTLRSRLRDDFLFYSVRCLKVRTKAGAVKAFSLNKAQQYIHEKVEKQLKDTGKVRANILKGRQQGCSTYVEGRFYWKATHRKGVRAFILTHEDEATKNLFEMAQRFHDHNNPLVKPSTGGNNARELYFDKLDSGYRVGTARTKGTGRSGTFQYFHGSEVAFWPHADDHAKGILQAIPDADGTESIRESTANGVGNYFHQQWKAAERGEGEYINIFIPWFWQEEYSKIPVNGFKRTPDEEKLSEHYGLTDVQLSWRRQKITDLSVSGADGEAAFKQEYPCNSAEAFQLTGKIGLIKPIDCMRARKADVKGVGALVVGVDPSRGGDRFSVIKRQGRKAYDVESYSGDAIDKLGKQVAVCKKVLDTVCPLAGKKPDMMFVDAGGGAELADRLEELGYEDRVKPIYFGATPFDPIKYTNKRNEMWQDMAAWMIDENIEVEIPDDDSIQADLCASIYRRDSQDRVVLWPKDKIKEELGYSPDEGDALALTFAEPVNQNENSDPYAGFR